MYVEGLGIDYICGHILCPFGIFLAVSGILYQEKPGNPGWHDIWNLAETGATQMTEKVM
jgi:hypothetical protein